MAVYRIYRIKKSDKIETLIISFVLILSGILAYFYFFKDFNYLSKLIIFSFFSFLLVYPIQYIMQKIYITDKEIIKINITGKKMIKWNEIKKIYIDDYNKLKLKSRNVSFTIDINSIQDSELMLASIEEKVYPIEIKKTIPFSLRRRINNIHILLITFLIINFLIAFYWTGIIQLKLVFISIFYGIFRTRKEIIFIEKIRNTREKFGFELKNGNLILDLIFVFFLLYQIKLFPEINNSLNIDFLIPLYFGLVFGLHISLWIYKKKILKLNSSHDSP